MREEQFNNVVKWQKETFGKATPLSKIAHLKEEIEEVRADLINGNDPSIEYADCFLLLFGSAACSGMTYNDICNAIEEKMEINKARKWSEPNEQGVVNHIKEQENGK